MRAQPIELGAFELGERIGEGGMGAVYRGRHRTTGVSVAIKVTSKGTTEGAHQLFRREVQAHAGLAHPGVVYIFEYGEVDAAAAAASRGELIEGSPFIAMELAERGTLRDNLPVGGWGALRNILLQVLDALAAAHARGVIHRDLKPENLLVFGDDDDAELRIKLADFGIAHAFDEARVRTRESLHSMSGTPLYMPPEQIRGQWRAYGPWTDLYALGCIAWELSCGRPPFHAEQMMQLVVQHLGDERPALSPRFEVPDSFDAWVRRAMSIDPGDRFRRAADAAQALPGAGPGVGPTVNTLVTLEPTPTPPQSAGLEATTEDFAFATTRAQFAGVTLQVDDPRLKPTQSRTGEGSDPGPRVPISSTWQTELPAALPAQLLGTGLGLFGLREVPFVDRDRQRDLIWHALREVHERATPRVVLVVGDSGAGKSRLVEWVTTRAHEVGAATVLRAVNTSTADATAGGLPGMVRRAFHGWKIGRGELYEHLLDVLPALDEKDSLRQADARALTELAFPSRDESESVDGPPYRFSGPRQKHVLIARLLRRFGRRRTPIVWLDDVQWDELSLGLIEHCLEQAADPLPALLIATLRSDVVAERPWLSERVDALASHERCLRIELEALAYEDHRKLIDRMLPLDPELAKFVADRTEGNPLFAAQALGDWIERDGLRVVDQGFRLREDFQLDVPDDIHQLWSGRLERMLAALGEQRASAARLALELAATLGRDVDAEEWQAVCGVARTDMSYLLRDKLIELGLARRTAEGWRFTHGLLVDSIGREAREGGRLRDHHRQCAELLEALYGEDHGPSAGRRARHWIRAGELERALEPLEQEARLFNHVGAIHSVRQTLQQRADVLDELAIEPTDSRRLANDIELAHQDLLVHGFNDSLLERLEQALERAREQVYPLLVSRASCFLAHGYRARARYDNARRFGEVALDAARSAKSPTAQIRALVSLGFTAQFTGELDAAAHYFTEAQTLATVAGERHDELTALHWMAWTDVMRGEDARAEEWFRKGAAASRDSGVRFIEAGCWNGLGDIARFRGEVRRARDHYEQSRNIFGSLGLQVDEAVVLLNLAQVELKAGRFDIAAAQLAESERRLEALGVASYLHTIQAAWLSLAAGTGDWAAFDRCFQPAEDGWTRDHAWLYEMAGDYADQKGDRERARRAWSLARELWSELGDDSAVGRLTDRLLAPFSGRPLGPEEVD